MYSVTREASFEAAHRLFNYPGKCRNLHGHSYRFIVTVRAEALQGNGMVLDFSELKKFMNLIVDEWDHAIILERVDPLVNPLIALDQQVVIFDESPTAEVMSRVAFNKLKSVGLNVESVTIYETEKNFATVRF